MAAEIATDAVSAKDQAEAERYKEAGNEHFKANRFEQAFIEYSFAIKLNPKTAVYYSNRAFCDIKLENYGSAVEDATKSIELDPSYVKAYYRRASAYFGQGKYKDALKDYKKAAQMSPESKDAQEKLKKCTEIVRLEAYAKAIENENTKPPSETVDLKTMQVEDSYDGPRLEEPITLEFVVNLQEHFRQQKKLHRKYAYQLILGALRIFQSLPTLVDVSVPASGKFTVCGDVHGQFYDFLNILALNGNPSPDNPYLFNGDFVDRGSFSIEVILTMFAWKMLYPQHFHMTRGNHESKTMNQIYGFQGEVKAKIDAGISFELFSEVFNWLPLAYVIGSKVLVVHGGLFSEDGVKLEDIKRIDRVKQPPDHGLMCELMWSDPQPMPGRAPSKRGVGLSFGPDVTERFLKDNNLNMLVRSHEVKAEGYEIEAGGKLVTVFSAPNYCDQMGNKGAYINFDQNLKPKYVSFIAVPHPPSRPMQYAGAMGSMFS